MSKILAVADIHINDYSQKNPTEKYRLYQTRKVCDNLIQVAKQEGADRIVIAGDTIEKYLIRPYIQAEVKDFLWNLMAHFKEGYIIWGNHDQDNKGNESELNDSCLAVMLPPNLYYADKKEAVIDGTRIGFLNWRPDLDLSWVDGVLDVLFTHATICYEDDGRYQSQYLDESKFDIAFCGDIHSAKKKGKLVSIGIPQKAKMGDSDQLTGIILDCFSKQWKWVNLNPNDNLLKLQYTQDKDQEGWHPEIGTWLTYKPTTQYVQGNTKTIQIPAWENVQKLIENSIAFNRLDNVHSKVLANLGNTDAKEVDFSFIIKRISAKNWRSIEDMEVYFDPYDKIKVVGPNGSGKSSFLTALKYAFIKNTDYKSLTQFGAKECRVEVDFEYQGNSYTLIRGNGSKNYGLIVNGIQQKYNSKATFEEDVLSRFPFIPYIQDVMFLDSDHPRFIGSITPERKSEIISRFYKMDILDAYNEKARELADGVVKSGQGQKEELERTEKLLQYIESKINLITLPNLSINELEKKREYGLMIQKKWELYNQWVNDQSQLIGRKKATEERLFSLNQQISTLRPAQVIQGEISELQNKLSWLREKESKLQSVIGEGKRTRQERQDLEGTKRCRLCGHEIAVKDLSEHKQALDQKLSDLVKAVNDIYLEFEQNGITDKSEINSGCTKLVMSLNSEISEKMSELREQGRLGSEVTSGERLLKDIEERLLSLGSIPEKVELPERFLEQMGEIESQLGIWKQYNDLALDKEQGLRRKEELTHDLEMIKEVLREFQCYIELTGTCGKIYEEIMNSLSTEFSDNRVVYEVERVKGRGSRTEHLNLTSYFVLGDNKVAYQNCSDGQKTFLDVDFMSKVLTKVGFLVFDEALKYLDSQKLDEVLEIIGQMDVGLVLLSSHVETLSKFNNKTMELSLNESGVTQVKLF